MAKPHSIKVSAEFPGLWLAAECTIAPEENVTEEIKKTRQLLIDAYKEISEPRLHDIGEVLPVSQVDKQPVEARIEVLIHDIENEKVLRLPDGKGGLLSWEKLVKSNPSLQPAYYKRLKELSV